VLLSGIQKFFIDEPDEVNDASGLMEKLDFTGRRGKKQKKKIQFCILYKIRFHWLLNSTAACYKCIGLEGKTGERIVGRRSFFFQASCGRFQMAAGHERCVQRESNGKKCGNGGGRENRVPAEQVNQLNHFFDSLREIIEAASRVR
jgi:hypothetical protein